MVGKSKNRLQFVTLTFTLIIIRGGAPFEWLPVSSAIDFDNLIAQTRLLWQVTEIRGK